MSKLIIIGLIVAGVAIILFITDIVRIKKSKKTIPFDLGVVLILEIMAEDLNHSPKKYNRVLELLDQIKYWDE